MSHDTMSEQKSVCHFCELDCTDQHNSYLLEGPAGEACICDHCIKTGLNFINENPSHVPIHQRCNMCGISKESLFYGDSPRICRECLQITLQLLLSALNEAIKTHEE